MSQYIKCSLSNDMFNFICGEFRKQRPYQTADSSNFLSSIGLKTFIPLVYSKQRSDLFTIDRYGFALGVEYLVVTDEEKFTLFILKYK